LQAKTEREAVQEDDGFLKAFCRVGIGAACYWLTEAVRSHASAYVLKLPTPRVTIAARNLRTIIQPHRRLLIPASRKWNASPSFGSPRSPRWRRNITEVLVRVLIADDNRDSADSMALLLGAWGFEPTTVYDGRTALKILSETDAPKLALLDWVMPGANGVDICRELRKATNPPYTYVIMVTGQGGKDEMLDGLKAGADDYLIKPVDVHELCARLRTAKRILDIQAQLLGAQHLLHELAARDSLTGLWNRRFILETLQRELTRSQREAEPVAIIMADIDHFKQINDSHGHLDGDSVLHQTAQRLLTALRPYDAVGRYGGEEFLMILPRCGSSEAFALAERLRCHIGAEMIEVAKKTIRVTLSLGVAIWDGEKTAQELLHVADSAMYKAKKAGRNRVNGTEAFSTDHPDLRPEACTTRREAHAPGR
jgi:two-component system cell cycle response regulator